VDEAGQCETETRAWLSRGGAAAWRLRARELGLRLGSVCRLFQCLWVANTDLPAYETRVDFPARPSFQGGCEQNQRTSLPHARCTANVSNPRAFFLVQATLHHDTVGFLTPAVATPQPPSRRSPCAINLKGVRDGIDGILRPSILVESCQRHSMRLDAFATLWHLTGRLSRRCCSRAPGMTHAVSPCGLWHCTGWPWPADIACLTAHNSWRIASVFGNLNLR